jgi:hypothetical protein
MLRTPCTYLFVVLLFICMLVIGGLSPALFFLCRQHWHVYTKWNERLFQEMYDAYASGRWDKDPSVGWYQGEIGFLDNYVIPLAKKLKNCGVFGVASDEYLNYAEQNRREWEAKGKEIVANFVEKHAKKARAIPEEEAKTDDAAPAEEAKTDGAAPAEEAKTDDAAAETKTD